MSDSDDFDADLTELDRAEWQAQLAEVSEQFGYGRPLGEAHFASFVEDGRSLIVGFETADAIRRTNPREEPRGWSFVRDSGWSALTIVGLEPSWFRDPAVYAYFDELIDDCFFDNFDDILFYGAGPGGYAAAAYCVAAPGSRVLALQPQATLDPRVAGWDTRFREFRRLDFTSRFGYAPDMVEAALRAYVIHDPANREDAMQAALFTRPGVLPLRAPRLPARLDRAFDQMGIMDDLIESAMFGHLDETIFARLWRQRRRHLPYLRATLQALESAEHFQLAARLCQYVLSQGNRPMFRRRLEGYVRRGLVSAQQAGLPEPAA